MRILIAVATCHAYHYLGYHPDTVVSGERADLIRATWKKLIPEGVNFKFFYGRGESLPKDDEVFLDVSDAFFAMPKKVQAIFRYAVEHNYDYVLECTDDVFINVPAILKSDFASYDYVGNALNLGGSQVPFQFCSGFAVWFSRKAFEIVANTETEWSNYDLDFNLESYKQSDNVGKVKWHDDLWIGSVLSKNGIIPHNDEHYIISVSDENGGPSTFPLDKAFAVHITPRFELMRELYNGISSHNDL